jgi:CDGSH-type Zn-finger protein
MCIVPEKTGRAFLCTCKQTANPPYCDGAHRNLPTE